MSLTGSLLDSRPAKTAPRTDLVGAQEPRLLWVPPGAVDYELGERAIEIAAIGGLELDPWQQRLVRLILSRRPGGKWAAFIVALVVSRQNGKGGVLEAIELAGLFLLKERLIIHTAHQFDTSLEAFYRLRAIIENTPTFHKRLKANGIQQAHGKEGFTLKSGQRLRYRARTTRGGGRGFTGDRVIVDEAMEYPDSAHRALLPTLTARANPQVILAGSAVDQREHQNGLVFAAARARGLAGIMDPAAGDDSLLFAEWSCAGELNDLARLLELASDPEAWAESNPALGYRITGEYIEQESRALDIRSLAVERLGIGDWPSPDEDMDQSVVGRELWEALKDPEAMMTPRSIAVEVRADFSTAAICVAGDRDGGGRFVDVVEHRPGANWVIARAAELVEAWDLGPVLYREPSAFAALLEECRAKRLQVKPVSPKEQAEASIGFLSATRQGLGHRGDLALTAAVGAAKTKPAGEAWKWDQGGSAVDVAPLWAVSLALWEFGAAPAKAKVTPAGMRITRL